MIWNEETYRNAAWPQIERGRPGDWGHACRAAEWVRRLSEGRDDRWLIIAAAYIHDIGCWQNFGQDGEIWLWKKSRRGEYSICALGCPRLDS